MALHPLLATGCAPHMSSSVSNAGLPSYSLPPSIPYSPSSPGPGVSYTNSPARCSSPQSYFAGMPMEASDSRPASSNGIARGDGFPFEPLHRRNRSQSQPPMQFVFNSGGFPQANNPLTSPHTASLGSAGYPVEFGPFVGNLEHANNQIKIGTAADHQQLSFNQPSAFAHAHSDVSLLPEHLSAARPLLSDGFRFPATASGSQPGAAPGAPALGGPRQRADTFDGLVGPTPPGAHVASPGRAGSATGSRFVDTYASQNLNLAPYIISNNGTDESRNRNPVSPMTPAHTQQFQGMLPFSVPLENSPVPPTSPRASDMMVEQSTYDHVTDRVAFPA